MTNASAAAGETLSYAIPAPRGFRGGRLLVWIVGTIVLLGMLISVLLPSLCRSSETSNRVKCQSNLRQIGQAIALYTQENRGQYPPSLAALMAVEDLTAEVALCPSTSDERASAADTAGVVAEIKAAEENVAGHTHCLSYVYAGRGLSVATATATTVVAYEPLGNHDGDGASVLYGDGQVDFVNKQQWAKIAPTVAFAAPPPTRP